MGELDWLLAEYLKIMPVLDPAQARLAVGLWRLLAEGTPVTAPALAGRLGVPEQQVAAALDGVLAGTHHQDNQGRIIAFWGLSLPEMPSPHRLTVDGKTLYAWCAPDTLWLPRVLGKTIAVQSSLETTGQPISLLLGPDGIQENSADGAVVSFVRARGKSVGDAVAAVMSSCCRDQLFFSSGQAAGHWAEAQGREDIAVFPVEQAIDGAGRFIEALVGSALHGRVSVELRSVPDCPNLARAREALQAALADLGLPAVVTEVVGDYPSPSILVNGVDVMGGSGDGPAACRLDLPTGGRIRAALRQAMGAESATAATEPSLADCWAQPGNAIRTDRPRRAEQLPDRLRQVHRAILRHFAATGTAPSGADIRTAVNTAELDTANALRELARQDLVAVDSAGRLVAAYPFSPTPTPHVVSLGDVEVFAMCAIDALGMPFMLGTDAVITSVDPHTGQPVRVTITNGAATFQLTEAVIVYAATGTTGRSVDTCCSTINFFTNASNAQAWIAAHPGLAATVLDQDQAVTLGRDIFEPLLASGRHPAPPARPLSNRTKVPHMDDSVKGQQFTAMVAAATRGRVLIPIPFNPDTVWGTKPRHHIRGTVNNIGVRGVVEPDGHGFAFTLGPAWLRGCGLAVGDTVTVTIEPEGPQRDDLAEDVAAALETHPQAAAFFDSLAQFYRRAYLRWIDATKRRPDQRPQRIAEMVQLLEAGHKERPQP
ncbi:organomercurial lyase [Micromonospora sp. NBC_00858]|uniref:organomercurial lyase n=1 Tax=Micromonospora sp. NBC_00858 TaxID=2975979 RepID=UPI003869EF76|nr:organomercurial lyase [Micromonospora sp. NBC_00858]